MQIIAMLIGATLGFWLGHNFDALVGGGLVGLIAGLIVYQYRKRSPPAVIDATAARFAAIETRLAKLEAAIDRAGLAPQPISPTPTPPVGIPPSDLPAAAAQPRET